MFSSIIALPQPDSEAGQPEAEAEEEALAAAEAKTKEEEEGIVGMEGVMLVEAAELAAMGAAIWAGAEARSLAPMEEAAVLPLWML